MNITCSGPGPHVPASGILGTADIQVTGMLCPSAACQAAGIAAQAAVDAATANRATIQQQAQTALTGNRAFIAAAKPGTAAAQASAAYDQSVAYGRQLNGVIRLLLNQLDATN